MSIVEGDLTFSKAECKAMAFQRIIINDQDIIQEWQRATAESAPSTSRRGACILQQDQSLPKR